MKNENIEKFFIHAMTDRELAGKVAALAGKNGYEFGAEELLAMGSAQPLDDTDVAEAAGGTVCRAPKKLRKGNSIRWA